MELQQHLEWGKRVLMILLFSTSARDSGKQKTKKNCHKLSSSPVPPCYRQVNAIDKTYNLVFCCFYFMKPHSVKQRTMEVQV
mmetsp:Transcript_6188/g.6744  ORF Transcript_6188/g.6744 Transcript_6188/m.6744 type:complete len:82 (+) Transcript_6188:215-460(+)